MLSKIHCANRKNTIRSNQFIQEHTPRTPSETTQLFKNLLLGLEFTLWLCVLSSSDRFLIPISCCKTHYQPNSFTHSLTNLLYWAYWAHILFYLGLGYDLWPYNMNSNLIGEFTKADVELALKQMAPLKAPGPDGMPLIFFQHYWITLEMILLRQFSLA